MAFDLRVQGRITLGGGMGGFSTTGAAKNQKVLVWGEIDITTYTAAGEPVTAADFGLSTVDFVQISPNTVDTAQASTDLPQIGNYDYIAQQVVVHDGDGVINECGSACQVKFIALGDSALAPELT